MTDVTIKKNNERSIEPFGDEKSPTQWFMIAIVVLVVLVGLYLLINTNII